MTDVSYDALGCSISQASASVLSDLVIGRTVTEGMKLHDEFLALIRSLSYPLHLLVRNQRLDLSPYIERLLVPPGAGRPSTPTWFALAASLADLLRRIAAERTLIERHVYLIVPADLHTGRPRQRGTIALFGRRRAQRQRERAGELTLVEQGAEVFQR